MNTFSYLRKKFGAHAPSAELKVKAELIDEIRTLKKSRNAVVLGHNYMEQVLYDTIPDFRGDSFALSRNAAETNKDVIVFCGVKFMAETAKLLNPKKLVLVPSLKAGCSLAESITAADVRELRKRFAGVPIVSYVNTYADVKAESDVCCTSSNAAKVVAWAREQWKSDRVIFLPDEYLARNVAQELGISIIVPKKLRFSQQAQMIGWKGRCEVHEQFTTRDIDTVRREYPDVVVLAHPECSPQVLQKSDFSGSTTALIEEAKKYEGKPVLLLTECSMGDNIIAENPKATILRLCMVRCPYMNQITLQDTRDALQYLQYQIDIPETIRQKAYLAVQRMINL